MKENNVPELLSPAGNYEKMRAAILYGADAVYLAGTSFGMRAAADNFTADELKDAVRYAHERNVRVYITVNIMPRTKQYGALRQYIEYLAEIGADALIISDIGVVELVKETAPEMEIHISTQASAVSAASCLAWHRLGAKRVVLARELSMAEIKEIRENVPDSLELEAFIHGSMCIAYSGRCLLSNYYTGRDGNRGACAQPCRWTYNTVSLPEIRFAEEKRQDDIISVEEDKNGSYIMASRDMCMIDHVPELMESGIDSFKIEGRMKSAYYTAVVTNAYKIAMSEYLKSPDDYKYNPVLMRELESVSHRDYYTGFYYDDPIKNANTVKNNGYLREKAYLATALSERDSDGYALFVQRNKLIKNDTAELISPMQTGRSFKAESILTADEDGNFTVQAEATPHPGMYFRLKVPFEVHEGDILRGGE